VNLKFKDNSFKKYCKSITGCFHQQWNVVKSHILAANAPSRIEISKKKDNIVVNEFIPCLKCGKLVGAKDKNPRKKSQQIDDGTPEDSSCIK